MLVTVLHLIIQVKPLWVSSQIPLIFCNVQKTSQIFVISCAPKDVSACKKVHSKVPPVEHRFYKMQKQVIVDIPKLWFHINPYLVTISQLHRSGFESCTCCNFQELIYKTHFGFT